jgi:hypothetical protein
MYKMDNESLIQLYDVCKNFIINNEITEHKLNYEPDLALEDAWDLINNLCNIIGHADDKDND